MPDRILNTEPTKKYDLVTFGESMIRLTPPGNSRLEESVSLDVRIGGSESNTAVAFARLGGKAAWWSKLPDNPLGRRIENEIRRWGVDVNSTVWDNSPESRAGLYFLDYGHAPRGIDVVYDRTCSSASKMRPQDVDTNAIKNSRILHLTGITPALSAACAECVEFAVETASDSNVLISLDINYRSKLWTLELARNTIEPMLPKVHLLICSLDDAVAIFAAPANGKDAAAFFEDRYGIGSVVITCGSEGAFARSLEGGYSVSPLILGQVADRVGAGDAFDAGVIWGYLQEDMQLGMNYGIAMSALKHTIPGDLMIASKTEVDNLVLGLSRSINR